MDNKLIFHLDNISLMDARNNYEYKLLIWNQTERIQHYMRWWLWYPKDILC